MLTDETVCYIPLAHASYSKFQEQCHLKPTSPLLILVVTSLQQIVQFQFERGIHEFMQVINKSGKHASTMICTK